MHDIAYAKINLALHVRARRADGYHALETLFAFAQHGDILTAQPGETLSLSITGPFADGLSAGDDNLVLRAGHALRARFGVQSGAHLTLEKRLPIAAGIGGGSADAAAALRLLSRLWDCHDEAALLEIAAALGADVPACLAARTVRGEGVGDALTPVNSEDLAGMALLLVNPRIACPTGPVFKAWDGVDRGALMAGDPLAVALAARNDLAAPAMGLVPEIRTILDALQNAAPVLARMSGSGATCFALYACDADRDAAADTLDPAWWTLKTRLR